ncbi:MAG: hypothetical protein ACE14L_00935 [Terriglobales bacterium]
MNEIVQRELQSLKGIVLNWKQSYLDLALPDGDNDFLVHDFLEEIETHVYPYTKRLYECNHLSGSEASEFLEFCYAQVQELRAALGPAAS